MTDTEVLICIYPGCENPAVAAHELGGPQPHFCELETHNAASAHIARQQAAGVASGSDEAADEA